MRVFSGLAQTWLRRVAPALSGILTEVLYGAANVSIGRGFRADGVPRCLLDKSARLLIGDHVEFRSGVEIRAHGTSRITIGNGVRIDRGVRILAANEAEIRIEDGSRIGLYSVFNGGDSITVGKNCLVSGFVYLQTSMHRFSEQGIPIRNQGYDHAPIMIGHGAWLAAHVVVMPGVVVGDGAIIGSNAVVTANVDPGCVVGGVPARPLKTQGRARA